MLKIEDMHCSVEDTKILHGVSLDFEVWKNYCVLGKNGSGKSSLAMSIMWHPSYEISSWDVHLDGESILEMEPDERSKHGIFLAFQSIPEIKWVKLFEFLRTIYNTRREKNESFVSFKRLILPHLEELGIDKEFLRRDLNVWFSGGERRKIEILQLKLLDPTYILLDEVDSGLDVDAFRSVAWLLKALNTADNSIIIITHYFTILEYIPVDHVYVMQDGLVAEQGWLDIAQHIQKNWFGK